MTLEELVREVFPVLIERDNGEVYVDCVFCEERGETADTRSRLGINYDKGTWNCFNCAFAGRENPSRLFYLLLRKFDLDSTEYRFTWRNSGEKIESEKRRASFAPVSLDNLAFEPLWEKPTERVHKRALKYMLERGVTKEQIENHFIGFCAVGKLIGRIVFPVYRKERVIGYVARAFSSDLKPKYLNSEGLKYLWNAPEEKKKKGILLEGIYDALASERALPKIHPMGCLGKDLTDEQLEAIKRFKEITVVPDPDKPGIEGAIHRARKIHEAYPKIKIFIVLPKKGSPDWGGMKEERIAKEYKRRVPWNKSLETRLRAMAAFM